MSAQEFLLHPLALQRIALDTLAEAQAHAATDRTRPIRDALDRLCGLEILNQQGIAIAPVTFEGQSFVINEASTGCAAVIPVLDEDGLGLDDLVAAELAPPFRIKRLLCRAHCVGLSNIFEARHHPQFRIPCATNAIEYFKAGCTGILPLDWRQTFLHLQQRGIGGLIADSVEAGEQLVKLQRDMLPEIPVVVSDPAQAVAA